MQSKIKIVIYQNGAVARILTPKSFDETKTLYYANAYYTDCYTQLIINKKKLTTAQAEKYLGAIPREICKLKYVHDSEISPMGLTLRGLTYEHN